MALSVKLFKPGLSCARFGDLPYINLLDKHENMMTAVPDPLKVTPVRAASCFCSHGSKTESGMFMGVSDCDNYTMAMSNPDRTDIYKLHPVTFRGTRRRPERTVMALHSRLIGNVTIGNFKEIW